MSRAPDFGDPLEPALDRDAVRDVLALLDYEGDADAVADGWTDPGYVLVHKHESGERVRLFRMALDEFKNHGGLDFIQRRYGAGKYSVDLRKTRGGVVASRTVSLGPPLNPEPSPAAAAPATATLERLIEKLAERAAPPAAASLPSGFLEAVTSVAAAMQKSQGDLLGPLIQALTQKDQRGDVSEKLMDVLLRGIELGKETAGDGSFAGTVRDLLPDALRGLQQLGANASAPPQVGPGSRPPLERGAPAGLEGAPTWARVLAPHVPQLMQLATLRADPEHWAEQIVRDVDSERLTFLEDQLRRGPAFREEFYQSFPDTMGARSWFEVFFDALAAELEELRGADDPPGEE